MPAKSKSAVEELALRTLRRRDLIEFTKVFIPDYQPGWVHHDIARRLEKFADDVVHKRSPRLMLFMPPQHGKSTLAAQSFVSWFLGHHPELEIILGSYGDVLARKHSRIARDITMTPEYRALFPNAHRDRNRNATDEWGFREGGGLKAVGVSTGVTGMGGHALVIDDPVKDRKEADSPGIRNDAWDWYTSTARTRLRSGGGILVIQTRWHVDDLSGRLLQQAKDAEELGLVNRPWEVVLYEAIAEVDEKHRKKGEALDPGRFTLEDLEDFRATLPERDWLALYQQKPTGSDGEFFRRADIQFYNRKKLKHENLRHYQAWDLAIGEEEINDYTVGIDVAVDEEGNLLGIDIMRGKWPSDQIVERMIDFAARWRPQAVGIESGHIQKSLGPWLKKRIRERHVYFPIQELKHKGRDKFLRAASIQAAVQHGRMKFPEGDPDWQTCIGEMIRFGGGGQMHDDQVDALAWLGLMTDDVMIDVARARRRKGKLSTVEERLRKLYRQQKRGAASRSAMRA